MVTSLLKSDDRTRGPNAKSLVGFFVGDVHYAVEIEGVREIVNPMMVTQLPHTPKEISGVADHRGDVVPVIDLRQRFGLPIEERTRSTKWILVGTGEQVVGLVVDRVTEVFGTVGGLKPPPPVGGPADKRGISGVLTHHEQLTFVLDVARFVELIASLERAGALPTGESQDPWEADRGG